MSHPKGQMLIPDPRAVSEERQGTMHRPLDVSLRGHLVPVTHHCHPSMEGHLSTILSFTMDELGLFR